jgi:hypothetical protein
VIATHQDLRTTAEQGRTVWTYYRSFAEYTPAAARALLAGTSWREWTEAIFADLEGAHPNLRLSAERPAGAPRVVFANSDLSGMSLFEEAQYRGVAAADAIIAQL